MGEPSRAFQAQRFHNQARTPLSDRRTPRTPARAAEHELRDTLDRLQRQFLAIGRISQLDALMSGDVDAFVREIAVLAAEATGCERVNIWLFNAAETELHCIELFEATTGRHSRGMVLHEPDFRGEFQTLKEARYVDADHPLTDPRTTGYVEGYLKPFGITSMLDAVVRVSGKNLGLLCLEHVGRPHHWERDEIAFACQIADKIGLALMTRVRLLSAERLRESEAALAEAQAIAHVGSWDLDLTTGALTLSKETCRIYGVDPETFVPSLDTMITRVHPDDRAAVQHTFDASIAGCSEFAVDYRIVGPDRAIRCIHARGRTFCDGLGRPARSIGSVQDVTERTETEATLQFANTLLRTEMEHSPDGIVVVGRGRRILSFNAKFAEMWRLPTAVLESGDHAPVLAAMAAQVVAPDAFQARITPIVERPDAMGHGDVQTLDGRFIDFHTATLRTPEGETLGRIWFFRDVTDRRVADELIRRTARQDALTGLANRAVFVEEVHRAIARTRRGDAAFAVLYLDLDRFKDINDTFGHPAGDALLQMVAARLRSHVRETDAVARFGGDEFAVMVTDIREPINAATLATTLIDALRAPFQIGGNDISSGASIGIAIANGRGSQSVETLLAHADIALYHAKSEGRGGYRFFTAAMDDEVRARVALTRDLREAIASGQLFLEYQPQVDAATGRVTGVEALVRWRHAERGVLMPDRFIRAAEESGLIRALSRWVLLESCRQANAWRLAGIPPIRLAVNLSTALLKMPADLSDDLQAALEQSGLPPEWLQVELTDTMLTRAALNHSDVMARLRAGGISVAIDDFGTGHVSLADLRRFPIDRLKIAQSLISEMTDAGGSAPIVRTTITLARELGIAVIAEGVESAEQLALLRRWGCQHAQGYYFARPLSADAVLPLLRQGFDAVEAAV
jgi:diguanylate cyclase (GGDEF)-like protein